MTQILPSPHTEATIRTQVQKILAENLPEVKPDEALPDSAPLFYLGLSSLNAVSLVLGLEDAFGFQFELDEIDFQRFRSVGDVVTLVQEKLEE